MTAVWAIVLVASVVVAAVGVGLRLRWLLGRPCRPERSRVAGSPGRGVLYAFTWGMMPWAKESTRIHLLAYLRGIVFHAGIAAGFLGLALSPWAPGVPAAVRWAHAAVAPRIPAPPHKTRHCIYFVFSRYFFGLFYGRRGVVGGVQHE